MKNKRRAIKKRGARREVIAAWVAATLLRMFVGMCLASLMLTWLRPQEAMQLATLERLLMLLAPLVTLAVQWYLTRRNRGGDDQ
jgi:hypothetical protein